MASTPCFTINGSAFRTVVVATPMRNDVLLGDGVDALRLIVDAVVCPIAAFCYGAVAAELTLQIRPSAIGTCGVTMTSSYSSGYQENFICRVDDAAKVTP